MMPSGGPGGAMPSGGPGGGPGGDCGGPPPAGAGGGSGSDQLDPEEKPFYPRGTNLGGAGTAGAPGDVLPATSPADVVTPASFVPGE